MMNRTTVWAAMALVVQLAACGAEKPEALLASAKSYLAKGDNQAAIIQIKNALQANAELAEGRYLLGAALLASGSPVQAEVELRKALSLGHDRDKTVAKLASAMIAQGQAGKLVEEFGASELGAGADQAEFKSALAAAHEVLGNAPQASAALAAALAADPNHVPARIADARRTAAGGDIDAALGKAEATLGIAPENPAVWTLKGDLLLFGRKDRDEALRAYRRAVELRPDHLPAHFRIGGIELERGKVAEAQAAVEAAAKVAPNDPEVRYQQTQLAILKKDFTQARESSQQLLKVAPESALALQLAGLVELQLNSLIQAETLLKKSLQKMPSLTTARKALIRVHLRTGNPAAAMEVLNAAAGKDGLPPAMFAAAGELYLLTGDAKRAEEYFRKAANLDPADSGRRMSVAIARMAGGEVASGMEELKEIAAAEASTAADLAVISTHLRRNEFDAALAAIDRLEKKEPDKPLAHYLRGRSLFLKGDRVGARASFEAALKADPTHFVSVASLAAMDLGEKQPDAARKRLEAAAAKDPKNAKALMGLAELDMRRGAPPAEVAALIERAVAASPQDPAVRVALIQHHVQTKNPKEAVTVANKALGVLPDNPDILFALGRAQLAAGDVNQAIGSLTKLASLQPRSPRPLLAIAEVHVSEGKQDLAAQSLRKALDVDPRSLEAQRGLVALDVAAKRYPDALKTARGVQKQRPKEPAGYVLEGDVLLAQQDLPGAEAAYRLGVNVAPSSELASKLYVVLVSSKPAEASKFAAKWQSDHPKDRAFLLKVADVALARQDHATAEKHYLTVTTIDPNNAVALNNLAWVSGLLNRPQAVSYAERALVLSPNEPAFLDTLAMLHSRAGEHAKAIEVQTRALATRDDPTLRLNFAKILIKAGEPAKAKVELAKLGAMGDKFAGQREVTNLMESINK